MTQTLRCSLKLGILQMMHLSLQLKFPFKLITTFKFKSLSFVYNALIFGLYFTK